MTYDGAIEAALRDLSLGTTEYSHEQYDDQLLQYAVAAVLELSKDCRPVAVDEEVSVVDGTFALSSLVHPAYNLLRVRVGNRVYHTFEEGGIVNLCAAYTGSAQVTYEYFYDAPADKTEEIPLPTQYHQLLPLYMVAQFQLGGDAEQQRRGQYHLQLFSSLRSSMHRPQTGATDSYRLKNRGW